MHLSMEYLVRLAMLFFSYSFLGWCIEVTLKFIQYHRFINRGFLTGPICPIYGSGATLITLAVEELAQVESGIGTTFALSFLICGAVEYFTSYFMEKRFHARWWDYSQKPMNLHGRIWIGNLVLFGLGGIAIIHLVNPMLDQGLELFSLKEKEIASACLLAVTAADYTMTHFVLKLVKTGVEGSEADNTEEINAEIHLLLSDRNIFYRRFADAYPEVIYRTERINARLAEIREETERIRQAAERRMTERKEEAEQRFIERKQEAEKILAETRTQVASALEPTAHIKNHLISIQSQLIDQIYDPEMADEQQKALKAEIDRERDRIRSRSLTENERHMMGGRTENGAGR